MLACGFSACESGKGYLGWFFVKCTVIFYSIGLFHVVPGVTGLDQDFNSLDAQHEACANYIASQKSEGWVMWNSECEAVRLHLLLWD